MTEEQPRRRGRPRSQPQPQEQPIYKGEPITYQDQLFLSWSRKKARFDTVFEQYRVLASELNEIADDLKRECNIDVPRIAVAGQAGQHQPPVMAQPVYRPDQLQISPVATTTTDLPMLSEDTIAGMATNQVAIPLQRPAPSSRSGPLSVDPVAADLQNNLIGGADGAGFLQQIAQRFTNIQNNLNG